LKLYLLDADVVIDLLELDLFDKLINRATVVTAETVAGEVRFFYRDGMKVSVDFVADYVQTGSVRIETATVDEIKTSLSPIPTTQRDGLHPGELESLAILVRTSDLLFCSCDAATIRALPFLNCSDRAISVEEALQKSGLTSRSLKDRHTNEYLQENIAEGQRQKILAFSIRTKQGR
jgi:hypothetical protein